MKDNFRKKVSKAVLDRSQKTAKQTAGIFCRFWLGEPKVPTALLEPEVKR